MDLVQQQSPVFWETVKDAAESDASTEPGSEESDVEYSDEDRDSAPLVPFSMEETFPSESTLLLFDWDDTVLPTTWIEAQGLRLDDSSVLTEAQRAQLELMAEHAHQTLEVAKTQGKVVLVTNAESGWVELSCKKFMPSLYPSLHDVKILSARSTFEQRGVARPAEWKYCAFQCEIERFFRMFTAERRKNVISVGDSVHEREALIRVTERMSNSYVKAVKFTERPGVEQLLKEHQLMSRCMGDIVNHEGSLDLCITCA